MAAPERSPLGPPETRSMAAPEEKEDRPLLNYISFIELCVTNGSPKKKRRLSLRHALLSRELPQRGKKAVTETRP